MNVCAGVMNAGHTKRFRIARNNFENRRQRWSVSPQHFSREIAMRSHLPWFRKTLRLAVCTAPAVAALLSANSSLAAQGPGGGPGTASSLTQLTMAIVVYGISALVVGAGLIGMARRH
jgi:hypothetical protein